MGSSSSKNGGGSGGGGASSSSSSSAGGSVRRSRSMGARVFQSSCIGRSFIDNDDDQVSHNSNKENRSLRRISSSPYQTGSESDQVKKEGGRKLKPRQQANEVPYVSSNVGYNQWGQETGADSGSVPDSSAEALSTRSLSSSRSRSRFSFIPGNLSSRLSRAASLGSSRAYSLFSNGLTASNAEEGSDVHLGPSSHLVDRNDTCQGGELRPVCNVSHLSTERYEDTTASDASRLDPATSGLSVILQNDESVSNGVVSRNNENTEILAAVNGRTQTTNTEIESIERRFVNRRTGPREPVERSVRFSRTLSVGRLRDRVLRRSSLTDGLFGRMHEDRQVGDLTQINGRQVWDGATRTPSSDGNAESSLPTSNHPQPDVSDSIFNSQDYEVETSRPREARYHDILEHRTDFLERRRRIRSQVRALQRLGSRFENLSGHERSCILSGQHRTGRCSCRTSNRTRNPDDDTSARASISRIVMLAEALFEVLDEIHQQSVVLSSRPSVSSLGSVPAPKEVVESLPVKIYTKSQKLQTEDVAQCYICLLEYEEGDCMRILPCQHEFHCACIDKWLKEIHRVCPLCRGDVCRSDSVPAES